MSHQELKRKANRIRRHVLQIVADTGKGHLGGTFSCIELFVALYYGDILRCDPKNPKWVDRDRFVVGKGHACLAMYDIFIDKGYMPAAWLETYGCNGARLSGQLNLDTPGVEYNTGSLGHAIGVAAGMALSARMDNSVRRIYALVGDGECAEGSIWESIMFSGQQCLKNLTGIIDRNHLGVTDILEDDEDSGFLDRKIKACGWDCIVIDGHSFDEIFAAFEQIKKCSRPCMIIADTIKGKGVSFMENGVKWHHSVPSAEEYAQALKELDEEYEKKL